MCVIATAPLTQDEPWEAMATGESRLFVDGEMVWQHRCNTTQVFPPPQTCVGRTASAAAPVAPAASAPALAG
jgi:hypothetical protein